METPPASAGDRRGRERTPVSGEEPPMTDLERRMLDALAEIIAADILRHRTHDDAGSEPA